MRLRAHAVLAISTAAILGAPAGAAPHARRVAPPPPSCPLAARAEVAVPDGIDEVRAIVAAPANGVAVTAPPFGSVTRGGVAVTAPPFGSVTRGGAAAAVMVVDGRADRELVALGAGAWSLELGSPLPAGRVVVAVEPVLDAPASACVDHVELLRRGAVVARVVPR